MPKDKKPAKSKPAPLSPVEKVVPIRPDMGNQTAPKTPKGSRTAPKAKPASRVKEAEEALPKRAKSGLTLKQEDFCHAYVETGNASEAYRRAYDSSAMKHTTITNNAHRLLKRDDIRARVDDIKGVLSKRVLVTIETLTLEFEEARKMAEEERQAAAMVAASNAKAKLHGFLVDKVENRTTQFVVEAPKQDDSTEAWLEAVTKAS